MSVIGWVKHIVGEGENDNLTLSKRHILDSYKLKEFAETISNLMKMAECSPNGLKTLWEKENLLATSNLSFSHTVFKRLLMQTRKNLGLFRRGLSSLQTIYPFPTLFSKDL